MTRRSTRFRSRRSSPPSSSASALQRVKHFCPREGLRIGELGRDHRPRREQVLREARSREYRPGLRDGMRHWQFRMAAWT
jgi:hypothetical protein